LNTDSFISSNLWFRLIFLTQILIYPKSTFESDFTTMILFSFFFSFFYHVVS
jgi:hypothetical protein